MSNSKLDLHSDTVIAVLACRIEQLEAELEWKQQRLENAEKLNAAYRAKLCGQEDLNNGADADPFGGDVDE